MRQELFDLLERKYDQYNRIDFIENDPILIPHQFRKKQDIEIAGFLAATIAWGNRTSIIKNANQLMELMEHAPHDFIISASQKDYRRFQNFVHRTFNGGDCVFFLKSLGRLYKKYETLEEAFIDEKNRGNCLDDKIECFRVEFLKLKHKPRVEKHVSSPYKGSSAKRLCMFLRWMVRSDGRGVDFGIWHKIKPSELCLPLDIHTGTIGRQLGLFHRNQNDWKAVTEITSALRQFDPGDPVKYDFALFGMGVNKDL